jgi:hypothetical protein
MHGMKRILVSGYMARYPLGGQLAAHFQYVLGLSRLGYEVHFVEAAGWKDACFDPATVAVGDDPSTGCALVEELLARHGLAGRWTFVGLDGRSWGRPREEVARWAKSAPLLSLSDVSWLPEFEECPTRVYIDEDPGFPQMGTAAGDAGWRAKLDRYDVHATYGESIGGPDCLIPTVGYPWIGTRPPIVPDLWATRLPPGRAWTTVMNWQSYANVTWQGIEYGQKDREFRCIENLPRDTPEVLEVAVSAPDEVREDLQRAGWGIVAAMEASRTLDAYRDYIRGSRGEFSVAKHAYVATSSGWFSDRSAAYLASGRPVVLQDTGFSRHLPTGEGLFAWTDAASAADALDRVAADLPRQARAAQRVADSHLRYDVVLPTLLRKAGVG